MDNAVGWYASLSGMIAALVIAADLGRRATGWAFALFVTSSIAWIAAGLVAEEKALLWQNLVLLAVNIVGVYRWLWRKAPGRSPEATATSKP
jgi:hypothetical protein